MVRSLIPVSKASWWIVFSQFSAMYRRTASGVILAGQATWFPAKRFQIRLATSRPRVLATHFKSSFGKSSTVRESQTFICNSNIAQNAQKHNNAKKEVKNEF